MTNLEKIARDFILTMTDNPEYIDVCEVAEAESVDPDELMDLIESARVQVFW